MASLSLIPHTIHVLLDVANSGKLRQIHSYLGVGKDSCQYDFTQSIGIVSGIFDCVDRSKVV